MQGGVTIVSKAENPDVLFAGVASVVYTTTLSPRLNEPFKIQSPVIVEVTFPKKLVPCAGPGPPQLVSSSV